MLPLRWLRRSLLALLLLLLLAGTALLYARHWLTQQGVSTLVWQGLQLARSGLQLDRLELQQRDPLSGRQLRLQLAGLPRCTVSGWEIAHSGPSYSVDTLAALQRPRARWWLVIGQDQYARLSTWKHVDELLQRCELAVAARAGEAVAADPALPPHRCRRLDLPADTVSASQVRERLARGDDVTPLVGTQVAGYIADHHLYRV